MPNAIASTTFKHKVMTYDITENMIIVINMFDSLSV